MRRTVRATSTDLTATIVHRTLLVTWLTVIGLMAMPGVLRAQVPQSGDDEGLELLRGLLGDDPDSQSIVENLMGGGSTEGTGDGSGENVTLDMEQIRRLSIVGADALAYWQQDGQRGGWLQRWGPGVRGLVSVAMMPWIVLRLVVWWSIPGGLYSDVSTIPYVVPPPAGRPPTPVAVVLPPAGEQGSAGSSLPIYIPIAVVTLALLGFAGVLGAKVLPRKPPTEAPQAAAATTPSLVFEPKVDAGICELEGPAPPTLPSLGLTVNMDFGETTIEELSQN